MNAVAGGSRAKAGTLVLVTAVTLLIWIFAAGETRERAVIWARVQFEPASSFSTIVTPRTTRQVALTLSGSARSIQQVRRALDEPIVLTSGTTGIPGEKGTHVVALVEALREQQVFHDAEVSVVSSEPSSLDLEIDTLIERTIPVIPVLSGATLGGEAVASPPNVVVTMPSRIVGLLPELSMIAEPAASAIAELEPGRRQVIQAPIRIPEELRAYEQEISVEPRSVQLAFTLILRTRSITVPAVPIQIAAPPQDLADYEVVIADSDQFLADVIIEGAAEIVNRFETEKPPVVAFVHLTSDDLSRGVTEAPVTLWQLPEGLRVTSVAGETPRPFVSLTITRETD